MMKWLRDISIKRKVTLVILFTTLAVLSLACMALLASDIITFRANMAQNMTVLANVLARNSTAPLSFQDENAARETLSALSAEQHIIGACLYGKDHIRFGDYTRPGSSVAFPSEPPPDGHHFEHDDLELSGPVMLGEKRIGTIYLRADLEGIYDRVKSYGVILGIVVIVAFLVTFFLAGQFQGLISGPIFALAETARQVAEKKDYPPALAS